MPLLCIFLYFHLLFSFFETGSLTEPRAHLLDRLAGHKPQGSVGVSATHHWVYGYAPPPIALKWVLVIQTPGTYTMITVPTEHLPAQSMVLTRGFSSFMFKEFVKYIQSLSSLFFLCTSSKNLSFPIICPPAVEQLSLKYLIFLTLILKPGGAHKHSRRLSPLGV